jgi:hypothetical protein
MIITGKYTCLLCENEFVPTKRGIQKFCSRTCGQKYNYHKNKSKHKKIDPTKFKARFENASKEKFGVDKITPQGVLQSWLGSLAAQGTIAFGKTFFSNENKPITKQETDKLKQELQDLNQLISTRYFLIENMDRRFDGALPHFDMSSRSLVYLKDPNYLNPADYIP